MTVSRWVRWTVRYGLLPWQVAAGTVAGMGAEACYQARRSWDRTS